MEGVNYSHNSLQAKLPLSESSYGPVAEVLYHRGPISESSYDPVAELLFHRGPIPMCAFSQPGSGEILSLSYEQSPLRNPPPTHGTSPNRSTSFTSDVRSPASCILSPATTCAPSLFKSTFDFSPLIFRGVTTSPGWPFGAQKRDCWQQGHVGSPEWRSTDEDSSQEKNFPRANGSMQEVQSCQKVEGYTVANDPTLESYGENVPASPGGSELDFESNDTTHLEEYLQSRREEYLQSLWRAGNMSGPAEGYPATRQPALLVETQHIPAAHGVFQHDRDGIRRALMEDYLKYQRGMVEMYPTSGEFACARLRKLSGGASLGVPAMNSLHCGIEVADLLPQHSPMGASRDVSNNTCSLKGSPQKTVHSSQPSSVESHGKLPNSTSRKNRRRLTGCCLRIFCR